MNDDLGTPSNVATVSLSVTPVIEVRVAASSDDAEERATGTVLLTSSDLELVHDGGGDQTVGMRFTGVAIPPGATIVHAFVQFQVDETPSASTSLAIEGEVIGHASTFTTSTGNISSRTRTTAAVAWVPPPWVTVGEACPDQQTPNITRIVQEIVNGGAWSSGNSLAIIITGTGERVAEAFDGVPAAAPLLHVAFQTGASGN